MKEKEFNFKANTVFIGGRKYIDVEDLLLAFYEASSEGFTYIGIKELTNMLKELKVRQ